MAILALSTGKTLLSRFPEDSGTREIEAEV